MATFTVQKAIDLIGLRHSFSCIAIRKAKGKTGIELETDSGRTTIIIIGAALLVHGRDSLGSLAFICRSSIEANTHSPSVALFPFKCGSSRVAVKRSLILVNAS